jgi:transposase InsO family protein
MSFIGHGSSYIAGDLDDWLEAQNMTHIRGAPNHPQTQATVFFALILDTPFCL